MFSFDDLSSVSLTELIATQNWQSQYRLITQWGKLITPKPEMRSDSYLLRGCETLVWMNGVQEAGVYRFAFDSDSRVINGLAALLLAQVNTRSADEIKAIDFEQLLIDAGLEKHLTPTRNNGLRAIIERIKELVSV